MDDFKNNRWIGTESCIHLSFLSEEDLQTNEDSCDNRSSSPHFSGIQIINEPSVFKLKDLSFIVPYPYSEKWIKIAVAIILETNFLLIDELWNAVLGELQI